MEPILAPTLRSVCRSVVFCCVLFVVLLVASRAWSEGAAYLSLRSTPRHCQLEHRLPP